LDIANPHRWNGRKDPYLYSVTVRVHRGNDIVDEVVQPLGLRTVAITQEQGFLLNGKPYPIHGVSRHQDRRDQGWALSAEDHRQDADMILEMGVTAVRNAHYPQSGTWHDLADRNGLLMWDEISLVRTINDTPAFTAGSQLEAREMILQLYNHPSIAFWGLFNELGNLPTPPPDVMLKGLKAEVKELDSSRVIVAATDHMNKSYNLIPDWTCYNIYPGWYRPVTPGPDDTIAQFSKEIGKRTALSEYGAGGNPFQHEQGPVVWRGGKMANNPFHPEEYQSAVHEADYAQIAVNPNLWGSFIWTMFDFTSTQKNEGGTVGINDKGMVTQDRAVKKDVFYFYKANWSDEPVLYITSRRFTQRTNATTDIKIYSNAGAVELSLNGKSQGRRDGGTNGVFVWKDVKLSPGQNQIDASAERNGKTLSDSCMWTLK
jgi:beta-galactosidase